MKVPTYGSVFMLSELWNGREKGEKERRGEKKKIKKPKVLQSVQGAKKIYLNTSITSIVIWNRVIFLKNTYSPGFRHLVTMIKQDPYFYLIFIYAKSNCYHSRQSQENWTYK